MIRPARVTDGSAIAEIWNRLIRETTATFTTVEQNPESIAAQIATGTPWWVVCLDGVVEGHATYTQFRGGPGYARCMEHSIHLSPRASGSGLGRSLMTTLETHARETGVHVMMASISSSNTAAQAFHDRLGYAPCGRVVEAGFKWGRYYDLVLMQKILT